MDPEQRRVIIARAACVVQESTDANLGYSKWEVSPNFWGSSDIGKVCLLAIGIFRVLLGTRK